MPLVPFSEVYKNIPKCSGEPQDVIHFVSICDGIYEDYFANSFPDRDKEFILLLTIKISPELHSCVGQQKFATYVDFRDALLSTIPEISISDAIIALQKITIEEREPLENFGQRVQHALTELNNTYVSFLGTLPQEIRESNKSLAIEVYANSINDDETRILLLSKSFSNFISAITFAEDHLGLFSFTNESRAYRSALLLSRQLNSSRDMEHSNLMQCDTVNANQSTNDQQGDEPLESPTVDSELTHEGEEIFSPGIVQDDVREDNAAVSSISPHHSDSIDETVLVSPGSESLSATELEQPCDPQPDTPMLIHEDGGKRQTHIYENKVCFFVGSETVSTTSDCASQAVIISNKFSQEEDEFGGLPYWKFHPT